MFLKDHYLVKTEASVIWSFYINRMIAFTFKRISMKQQLSETLIDKLMLFVESLDKLIDRLKLSHIYLAEFFPRVIFDNCEEIREMKEPDILKTFANQIIYKTIKFKGNKKEKIVEFDNKEIEELVEKEIKDLRLDAVNALYNACSKNQKYLKKERINKITKCLGENRDNDPEFICILQKIIELIEFSKKLDYKSLFNIYVDQLYKKDFSNSDYGIRFLGSQSRNEEKCQELFNVEIIRKLIEIFKHSEKQDVLEIINNYLNHESSKPLNKQLLETLIELSEKYNEVFLTILLSVNKSKEMDQESVKKLISNSEFSNFKVVILSKATHRRNEKELEYISSTLMSNDVYDVNSKIEFKSLNSGNSEYALSLLSSNIILDSLCKKIAINEKIIENLIKAIEESEDKQTRIICAKCIHKISETEIPPFNDTQLNTIYSLAEDPVYDVRVYMQTVFCRCLALLAKANKRSISNEDVQSINSFFLFEDLILGSNNFKEHINGSILSSFQSATIQQEFKFFDENFKLFESIFFHSNEKTSMNRVIQILEVYTKHHRIPLTTIAVLENSLEGFPSALITLQNVINKGQAVGENTLKLLIDDFYISNRKNAYKLFCSFKIIERAQMNQEFSDSIFFKFELIKAAYGLSVTKNKELILDFLKNFTQRKSVELPFNLINALKKIFNNEDLEVVIEIFENTARNHQILPDTIFEVIEKKIEKVKLQDKIINIFVEFRPEKLSENIFSKIIAKLNVDIVRYKKYLSAVLPFLEHNNDCIKKLNKDLESIIENGLSIDDPNIQEKCIRLLKLGVIVSDQDSIDAKLEDIETRENCPSEILNLIGSLSSDGGVKATNELARLKWVSNEQYIQDILKNVKNGARVPQNNFPTLKKIIDLELNPDLLEKTLDIVNATKESLPENLIDSIALLLERGNSDIKIRRKCRLFLKTVKNSGKIFSATAGKIFNEKVVIKSNASFINLIDEFQFDDTINKTLLEFFEAIKDIGEPKDLEELLAKIIDENEISFLGNAEFNLLLKSYLKKCPTSKNALQFYAKVLKEQKVQSEESLLSELIETCNCLELLVECIYNAIENKNIIVPKSCFELLKESINSRNSNIRIFSFKGLRLASSSKEFEFDLKNYCVEKLKIVLRKHPSLYDEAMKTVEHNTESIYDLFEVIWSVNNLDFGVFYFSESGSWRRELIISELFQIYNPEKVDKKFFYKNLLENENSNGKNEVVVILSLFLQRRHSFGKFNEIIETLVHVKNFNFKSIIRNLNYSFNPYKLCKIEWCELKIKERLSHNNVSSQHLRRVCELLSTLNTNFIIKFLKSIKIIDDLELFNTLIKFCFEKKLTVDDLVFGERCVKDLALLIRIKYICSCLPRQNNNNNNEFKLYSIITSLLEKKWNLEQLQNLIESINNIEFENPIKNCIDLLSIIEQFNLQSTHFEELLSILKEQKLDDALKKFNSLAVESYFQAKTEKNKDELLIELQNLNPGNQVSYLKKQLDEIFQNPVADGINKPIKDWENKDIKNWMKNVKKFNICEAVAVIKKAIRLDKGFEIKDTQIICCLVAYQSTVNKKGKLLQVATGEGKSIIVSILAILSAIEQKIKNESIYVNIITSSPVLAERDAKRNKILYEMFNLTCSYISDSAYLNGQKECYKSNIVYGDISQFQFDKLRHEYSQLETLGNRKCKVALIDEVDVMLIDDSSKIAKLASKIAGLSHFQAVYALLWYRIMSIKAKLIQINNQIYFLKGKVDFEDGKFILTYEKDETTELSKINDLEDYLKQNNGDIGNIGEAIKGDISVFLENNLKKYLDELHDKKEIRYTKNFQKFFERQKPIWIKNAIEALYYQENVDYVVQDGEIKPVDYCGTGVVLASTHWSDGLHQFLQLKHNLKMTDESLTTNFLSKVGYINSFEKIYGLTGTLGSPKARDVLKNAYNVDLIVIPQNYKKQFIDLPTILIKDEKEWLNEVCSSALLEFKKDRGILIVCETIHTANAIADALKVMHGLKSVKLYTMNDRNQERNVEAIEKGEIIVATMIAGRGTDIQTKEIEETGGLHIILTFLPNNQRVEDQVFGRTSRQGNYGTGQKIFVSKINNHQDIKVARDKKEIMMLEQFSRDEFKLISKKDALFQTFCEFLKELRDYLRSNDEIKCDLIQNLKKLFKKWNPNIIEENILASVEEQWAYFLIKFDDKVIKIENAETELKEFINDIWKNLDKMDNPYHSIRIGNSNDLKFENSLKYFRAAHSILNKEVSNKQPKGWMDNLKTKFTGKEKTELDIIVENIESLINSSEDMSGASFVGIVSSIIKSKREFKKHDMLKLFEKALKTVSDELSLNEVVQTFLSSIDSEFVSSDLQKQLINKKNLLNLYASSIQECVNVTRKSLRLINLTELGEKHEIHYFDLERNENKEITNFDWKDEAAYELIFNDLIARNDSGTKDQAIETINRLFDDRKKIRLKLKNIGVFRIKALLNPHKEFEELTKEIAQNTIEAENTFIEKLKNIRSSKEVEIIKIGDNKSESMEIQNSINMIKGSPEDSRFSFKIKNVRQNDINQNLSNICMQAEFEDLDFLNAKDKISELKAESYSIVIFGQSNEIISKLSNFNHKFKFCNFSKSVNNENIKQRKYEIITQKELKAKSVLPEANSFCVTVPDIDREAADALIEAFKDNSVIFTVICKGFQFEENFKKLNIGTVNFYFDNLNKAIAEKFIQCLRKENIDFCLEFKNLKSEQAREIIKKANLDQEDIEYCKTKTFYELIPKSEVIPEDEINELASRGIEFMIEIKEKGFIPWRTIGTIVFFASIQLAAGAILYATGFGAYYGIGLLAEGAVDLFMAFRAYQTRTFSWREYVTQKTVSLAISLASAGYGVLSKNIGNKVVAEVGQEVIEQGATQFMISLKEGSKEFLKKAGKFLVSEERKIATDTVIATGKIAVNLTVDRNRTLSPYLFEPQINTKVEELVCLKFSSNGIVCLLRKFHAIDNLNPNIHLKNKIYGILKEILDKSPGLIEKEMKLVGTKLAALISSLQENKERILEVQFITALQELPEIHQSIEIISKEFLNKLKTVDKKHTMTNILQSCKLLEKGVAEKYSRIFMQFEIIDQNEILNLSESEHIKTKISKSKEFFPSDEIFQFLNSLCSTYEKIEIDQFNKIFKDVSTEITEQLIRVLNSQMQFKNSVSQNQFSNIEFDFPFEREVQTEEETNLESIPKYQSVELEMEEIELLVERDRRLDTTDISI
jgi:preprotein translocase subunit SecA